MSGLTEDNIGATINEKKFSAKCKISAFSRYSNKEKRKKRYEENQ